MILYNCISCNRKLNKDDAELAEWAKNKGYEGVKCYRCYTIEKGKDKNTSRVELNKDNKNLPEITIYTDGSANNHEKINVGGYAAILLYKDNIKNVLGAIDNTTSNRMEITAAIEGIKAIKKPCNVIIYSDSQYLVNSIEKGWARNWKKQNWKDKGKDRLNKDLFNELLNLIENHKGKITFKWIPRNSHPLHAECDRLSKEMSGVKII